MGRKRIQITAADRDRWIQQWTKAMAAGRYEPYTRIQDIRSLGNKFRICGPKSGGLSHHFLSYNETLAYYRLAHDPSVDRIFDQFALTPITKTKAIAQALEIKHPSYPYTKVDSTMSTDIVVRYHSGEWAAIAVKPEKELAKKRVREKLAIEEAYWALKNIPWRVETDVELRIQTHFNLEKLHTYWFADAYLKPVIQHWIRAFCSLLATDPARAVWELVEEASRMAGIGTSQGQDFFYHALWHRDLLMDWKIPLLLDKPAVHLGIRSNVVG